MQSYLPSVIKQFAYYRSLGEKAMNQISDESLFLHYNDDSNSAAVIVKHLWGNMLSRWTDFLTSDGEKDWRDRDAEFENDLNTRADVLKLWNEGWNLLESVLNSLTDGDLNREVLIRNQSHTVVDAINRQLAHYAYHVGQLVYLSKMYAAHWNSLSIPKGASKNFNDQKFSQGKHGGHFTDEFLKK